MTLAFFKYGFPLLFGYVLFAGISGRMNPFSMPSYPPDRASRWLAIWIGVVVSGVLAAGLHMAYNMTPESAISLLLPSASILACLILPALGFYAYYRLRDAREKTLETRSAFNWNKAAEEFLMASREDNQSEEGISFEASQEELQAISDELTEVSPAYLTALHIDHMNDEAQGEAVNDPVKQWKNLRREFHDAGKPDGVTAHAALADEIALREETEKHLRITRKALSVLESQTRNHSIDKADALIELEEKLARTIESAIGFETAAVQEKSLRTEIEDTVVELKHRMVKAKQEIRHGAASRAKALSTANKSIALARQSMHVRARLETELNAAKVLLGNRQKTICSLVRALEKEKRKTHEKATVMARQLVLQEQQIEARRSLEGVARSVENKLTSRLVKKVAKARPLTSGIKHSGAG